MHPSEINDPKTLGNVLKDIFKTKYGIDIRTRYIKTVRGLEGSWYEVSTFRTNQIIPNSIRKNAVELITDKPIAETGVLNTENISYGTINSQRVSIYGRLWKKWLENEIM